MKSLQYINSIIASKKDIGLLVFRILIGIAFIWHGVPKLLSGPEGWMALGSMMGALGIQSYRRSSDCFPAWRRRSADSSSCSACSTARWPSSSSATS